MINGATSRIIYLGAYLLTFTCIVGFILLGMSDRAVGPELYAAFGASLGIIGGAHLRPPMSPGATKQALADNARDGVTGP